MSPRYLFPRTPPTPPRRASAYELVKEIAERRGSGSGMVGFGEHVLARIVQFVGKRRVREIESTGVGEVRGRRKVVSKIKEFWAKKVEKGRIRLGA